MALIVAFPYTGVAFAHTETMKMDEPGSVHPPGVCFTLFFYSLPPHTLPATSLLFFLFSFIRLLAALSLFLTTRRDPVSLSHNRSDPPSPSPGLPHRDPLPGELGSPPPGSPPVPSRALSRLRRRLSVKGRDAHLGFVIIY